MDITCPYNCVRCNVNNYLLNVITRNIINNYDYVILRECINE